MADVGGRFVAIVVILGFFSLMLSTIPLDFLLGSDPSIPLPYYETEWATLDFLRGNYTSTDTNNITRSALGGTDFTLDDVKGHIYVRWYQSSDTIRFSHTWYEWFILFRYHFLDWYEPDTGEWTNDALTYDDIINHQIENSNCSYFQMKCDCGSVYYVYFGFDDTLYSSFSEAWDAGKLSVFIGVGYETMPVVINAWNLIGMLLSFSLPDINPIINALIAIPLWAMIAYVIYILILKAIPFLGG